MGKNTVEISKTKLRDSDEIEKYIKKAKGGKKILIKERKNQGYLGPTSIKNNQNKILLTFKGLPASPGEAEGDAIVIEDKKSLKKVEKGKIVVLKDSTPQLTPYLVRSDGLIGERRSLLCHLGVLSREYQIPCLLGVKKALEIIDSGDYIRFDTRKETVEVIK